MIRLLEPVISHKLLLQWLLCAICTLLRVSCHLNFTSAEFAGVKPRLHLHLNGKPHLRFADSAFKVALSSAQLSRIGRNGRKTLANCSSYTTRALN